MKKSMLFLYTGLLLTAGFFQGCKSGQAVDLKLNLQPGSQYSYVMETKTSMDQTISGMAIKTSQDMTMETTYDVAAGDGSNKTITVTYNRIAMHMKNSMMDKQYDSKDSAGQDPDFKSMGNILNKPFTMVVTERGEITKIEGLDNIVDAMGDTTTTTGATVHKQMKSMFSDTAFRSMMQQLLNIFPDQPVRPGDTWKKTINTAMGFMNMKVDDEFKLDNVSNGVAKVTVDSKISSAASTNPEMKNIKMELAGDQKGYMEVEVTSGLVKDSKMTQKINGSVSAMGMKIPMKMTTDIHITGKKK